MLHLQGRRNQLHDIWESKEDLVVALHNSLEDVYDLAAYKITFLFGVYNKKRPIVPEALSVTDEVSAFTQKLMHLIQLVYKVHLHIYLCFSKLTWRLARSFIGFHPAFDAL